MTSETRYSKIIEAIFFSHYFEGITEFEFHRKEIEKNAIALKIKLPKNIGDIIYSFRYRVELPESIKECAPAEKEWVIMPAGRAKYRFVATEFKIHIKPNELLAETKVPDSTPGIISMYALDDEQALLAKLRYNRLVDIFTGVTCYSLQNHLRTFVPEIGQVETDEIYVGVDRKGSHYVFPVQAKGGKDKLSTVQILQDIDMCNDKFPSLICRPVGAQFISDNVIALFEFEIQSDSLKIGVEKHYKLVHPDEITPEDLKNYKKLSP